MNKKLSLNFNTQITNIKSFGKNDSFDYGVLKVAYTGLNRNQSFISKEAFEQSLPSFDNVPVVANYIDDKEDANGNIGDFGGHDAHLEINEDKNGNMDISFVNDTEPVGVVPESAKKWFEVFEEDGEMREYLCTEVLLWKRQKSYKKILELKTIAHSMEIEVSDGEFNPEGYFDIRKFELTALTLLGTDVEPCFEQSCLNLFSKDNFKQQYYAMLEELKNGGGDILDNEKENQETVDDVKDEEIKEESLIEEEVKEDTKETVDYELMVVELTKELNSVKTEYEKLQSEVVDLREFKKNKLDIERQVEEDQLFAEYNCLVENEDYIALKEKSKEFKSIQEIEKELALIYARQTLKKSNKQFSKKEEEIIKIPVGNESTDNDNEPYGGLYKKYLGK